MKRRLSAPTEIVWKRLLLGLCAVAALAVGLTLRTDWREVVLNAQESSPLETPGALPSPTPSRRVVNEIIHPQAGDAAAGFVQIIGTPLIQNFDHYDVHIAPAGSEAWQWLASGYRVIRDDVIYTLDSTQYEDGAYDIRVRAVNNAGVYDEAFLRGLRIRNAFPPTPTPVFNPAGTRVYVIPTQTPTPIPTATPVNETRSSQQQGFFAPVSGQVVQGYVPVIASVFGFPKRPFERYELALSGAGLEQWSQLDSGTTQHWQETIYLLNSYRLPDGFYDIRLRNVYRDSNYDEYFVRGLRVANESAVQITAPSEQANGFHSPRAGETIGGTVTFQGTALASNFLRWELYWSPAGAEAWAFLASGEEEVLRNTLARLDLSLLPAGNYDFMLRVVRKDYNYDDYFVRNLQVIPPTATPYYIATLTPTPTP
jgi:hypothetical protein